MVFNAGGKIELEFIVQCSTEVHFASFLSGELITAIVVNPPERKLTKHTSVQWYSIGHLSNIWPIVIF